MRAVFFLAAILFTLINSKARADEGAAYVCKVDTKVVDYGSKIEEGSIIADEFQKRMSGSAIEIQFSKTIPALTEAVKNAEFSEFEIKYSGTDDFKISGRALFRRNGSTIRGVVGFNGLASYSSQAVLVSGLISKCKPK